MIQIKELTQKDIGKEVLYLTPYKKQKGKIKSWNEKFIFVVYNCNDDWDNFRCYTGVATEPHYLFMTK